MNIKHTGWGMAQVNLFCGTSVSYTHLDEYKRQVTYFARYIEAMISTILMRSIMMCGAINWIINKKCGSKLNWTELDC